MDNTALFAAAAGIAAAIALAPINYAGITKSVFRRSPKPQSPVALLRAERAAFYDEQARLAQLAGRHDVADDYDHLAGLARSGGLDV